MLSLDHIPFYAPDAEALAASFATLGFTLSPPSVYMAPDHAEAQWRGRCVFLRSGWFDLIQDAGARRPGAPAACLFRAPDLAAATAELANLNPESPTRLERRWRDGPDLRPEAFVYAALRTRIAPVGLAVIEHAWPCVDVLPAWFDHPNGAVAVAGLVFGGEAPGPAASHAAGRLDLTGFEYWPLAEFDAAFPDATVRRAVRVRVEDLGRTRVALRARGLRYSERDGEIVVPAQAELSGGFLFSL